MPNLDPAGVEAAAKAISSVRYTAARQRANGQFVDEQDEFKRMALAAAPYLRAVPESDELVRLREALQRIVDLNPGYDVIQVAQRIANAALSPDEAAGGE